MKRTTVNHLPLPDADQPVTRQKIADLIERIRKSADKLEADQTSRGDLKILSRTLRELRYAFKVFAPYRARRKVTIFGSARVTKEMPTYQQAVELGRAMAAEDWLVVTGAASGIMEAGHVGAGRDHAMGLNIMLPFEQVANEVIRGDHKLVNMKYFFTRKLMFVKECDAVVCLPGGFGTLDEAMEVITLLQTGKRELVPVVLLDEPGGTYWTDWQKFVESHLLQANMISESDFSLYKVLHSVDETVQELLTFYRRFHSMRYVKNQLVFRLHEELHPAQLDEISRDFDDILASGEFHQRPALPDEGDEPQLAHLPRLVFHFNRRSLGRLRELVDAVNRGSGGVTQNLDTERNGQAEAGLT
jgi:uncharacterized protein (TIGR00730 family)